MRYPVIQQNHGRYHICIQDDNAMCIEPAYELCGGEFWWHTPIFDTKEAAEQYLKTHKVI